MKYNLEVEWSLLNTFVVENLFKFNVDKKIKIQEVSSYTHVKFILGQ